MKDRLRQRLVTANRRLSERGLVMLTWGNVSCRDGDVFGITPSGIPYDELEPEDVVLLDMDGDVVEGDKKPSSDTPTHLELYRELDVDAIVHTHSTHATMFAQATKPIDCLGTTHADHFCGSVPVTRYLDESEMDEYERNTGRVIVELFEDRDPAAIPGALVAGHAPFVWGESVDAAVENAAVLEEVARMNLGTLRLDPDTEGLPSQIREKHYQRKHGSDAYYGQQ
ncbi:L-ribulose-5-phosphate 4-epimerase AraD [Halobaculum sp. P14]|uniref:L-ribulose-5-phosphate 4-epimerase AraD n=1 Tax=Halobaculum sp. P14 TaxID=3421638 RepID=UPI003EBE6452